MTGDAGEWRGCGSGCADGQRGQSPILGLLIGVADGSGGVTSELMQGAETIGPRGHWREIFENCVFLHQHLGSAFLMMEATRGRGSLMGEGDETEHGERVMRGSERGMGDT